MPLLFGRLSHRLEELVPPFVSQHVMVYDHCFYFLSNHLHVEQGGSEEFFAYSESLKIGRRSSQDNQTRLLVKYDFDRVFRDWSLYVRGEDDPFARFFDHARQDPSQARFIFTVWLWRRKTDSCFSKLERSVVRGLYFLSPLFRGLLEHPTSTPLGRIDFASKVFGENNLTGIRFL